MTGGVPQGPVRVLPFVEAVPEGRAARWSGGRGEARDEGWRWEGPGFVLDILVSTDADGLLLRGRLEATGTLRLSSVGLSLSTSALEQPDGLRFFRHGYASWTPTASFPWDHPPPRPLSWSFAVANHAVDTRWWSVRDGMASHGFTLLTRAGDGLLVGFLAQQVGLGEVFLGRGEDGRARLVASLDYGGKQLAAGEQLELEPLRLSWGEPTALLERYVEEVAAQAGVASMEDRSAPAGWCSWYHFYTKVTDPDVVRNARALTALAPLGLTLVQLDDGYQAAVGDWTSLNAKFPRGLGPLAADIRGLGFEAGLWTAPFMATRRSRLVKDHPDRVLRDDRGRMVDCGLSPSWRDRVVGLDLSHPAVGDWLHALFRSFSEQGFSFFKLDFLYAALRRAARHDPRLSPVESYRLGLRRIREGVGPRGFLLGCGAPILPSVGLVDGMRVSGDVREGWGTGPLGWLGADCGGPSLRESARDNVTRAAFHRKWWWNDPDCLLVRDRRTDLDLDEVRFLVTVVGMTGGLGIVSDDLELVPEARRALLAFVLPMTRLRPRSPDLFERPYPERFVLEGARRRLVALLNWEGRPVERVVEPAEVWRFDAWRLAPVGSSVTVPRHGACATWETPKEGHPRLVGADLHMTGIVDGRLEDAWDGSVLRVSCRDLAPRPGRLWIAVPAGWKLAGVEGPGRVAGAWEEGVILEVEAGREWEIEMRW